MNEENGKEIIVQDQGGFSLQPRNLDEACKLAEIMGKSDLVPKDYKGKTGNILVAVQMGSEVGLKPMAALQNIAVINGRPCIWGDAALAIVKAHPDFEYIKEDDEAKIGEKGQATCLVKRRGEPEVISTFSKEDAVKARLSGKEGPWKTYPNRMMKMRARGFALRDSFPDALKGLVISEEAQDYVDVEHKVLPDPVEVSSSLPEPEEKQELQEKNGNGGGKPRPEKKIEFISDDQKNGLDDMIANYELAPLEVQEILTGHDVESLSEIPRKKYVAIIKALAMKGQQLAQSKA